MEDSPEYGINKKKELSVTISPTDIICTLSREHITIDGMRFTGISLAEVHRILVKYGYENEKPF